MSAHLLPPLSLTASAATGSADSIDLKSGWDTFWGAVKDNLGPITALMNIIGVAIVVAALIKWAWDRRRGQGGMGNSGAIWGALLVGCLLSAPGVIIPIFLTILDVIANAALTVWNNASGGK